MRFQFNPFTRKQDISGMGPGATSVDYLTGNSGDVVPADSGYNINVIGSNLTGINTIGTASTNTLEIYGLAASTTQVGTQANATNAQASAQSSTTTTLTPSNIPYLFATNYLPSSQGGNGLSSPAAHQLTVTAGSSAYTLLGVAANGAIPIGSVASDPVLATITPLGAITITNGPGSISIGVGGGGLTWQTISANQALATNHGYFCISPGGALSLSLPSVSAIGDTIEITVDGATSFAITQGANQQIRMGNLSTTSGVGGSITSAAQGDTIRLVCQTADLKWNAVSSMGNLTIV